MLTQSLHDPWGTWWGTFEPQVSVTLSQVRSSKTSGMLTHTADFEAENFEAALRHVVQKLVDEYETDVRMTLT